MSSKLVSSLMMLAQIADEEVAAERIQPEQFKEIESKMGEYLRPGVESGRLCALISAYYFLN